MSKHTFDAPATTMTGVLAEVTESLNETLSAMNVNAYPRRAQAMIDTLVFLTSAPEMAAENDRLRSVNAELLESLDGLCGLAALRPGHLQDYKTAIMEARAAIAKARGEG